MNPFIEAMAKHLPPSAASLRLLDVGGAAGDDLVRLRPDLVVTAVPADSSGWDVAPESADAVVALDCPPESSFLAAALVALRPGGRMIVVLRDGAPNAAYVETLESAGWARILVEPAVSALPIPGVLIRGEKPHTTPNTLERIRQTAEVDPGRLDFVAYSGRYVHLLVRQTPNKPVWKLAPGEQIAWNSVAVAGEGAPALLAFTSLPRAVAFMQPAVVAGLVRDINKIVKYSRATVAAWGCPVRLNPALDDLDSREIVFIDVDPAQAETPDE